MDPLEKVLRPVIEGQIRSFVNDHPEVASAVNWYKRRVDKKTTLVNSITKRILRDLLCPDTRMRLIAAVSAIPSADTGANECAEVADEATLERFTGV